MCRLFAYIGHEQALLEDVLVNPAHALTQQVHDHYLPGLVQAAPHEPPAAIKAAHKEADLRNKFFNIDGFGVAFYTTTAAEFNEEINGPYPAVYKSVTPALTDPNFLSLCANISSNTILAHVRATSLSPVVQTNCHPFCFGRHSFMHNGLVAFFNSVRRPLSGLISPEFFAMMKGTTDSEHLAALYMTYLGDGADEKAFTTQEMKLALEKTIRTVQDIQQKVLPKDELEKGANDLNLVTTDGERLIAVRWRNHPTEQPPSLYVSTTAGIALNRKFPGNASGDPKGAVKGNSKEYLKQRTKDKTEKEEHGLHVIVASEPTTFRAAEWSLLDKNHVIMVDENMQPIIEELQI